MRHFGEDTAYTNMSKLYKQRKLEKIYRKYGFDAKRLEFLKEELAKVVNEVDLIELQKYS